MKVECVVNMAVARFVLDDESVMRPLPPVCF
jgi:hypothetical protein